ncbi:MAG: OmpA family protein [Bacteroidales bacterium]|nr:OmpA family protein [Bacteroidales bacterium]
MDKYIRITVFMIIIAAVTSCSTGKLGRDAILSHQIGEYYKAIEKYRKASRKEKDRQKRMDYAFAIAECYRYIGDYERAALYYRNAIRRGYTDPVAVLYLAEMQRNNQDYEGAVENYRTYLNSNPSGERARAGLESIQKTQEWIANPTRHIINPIKEINSRESDFSPAFVGGRDNDIIFTSSRKAATGKKSSMITGQSYTDLFRATFNVQRQKWDQPKLIDEYLVINTGDEEGAATLSSLGDQMIFTRCRYDKSRALGAELYSSSQSRGTWSQPIKVQVVSDSLIAAHPSLNSDGSVLYFVSDMPGGLGGKDIWKAEKEGGSFSKPVNLGPQINTPGDEMFPYIRDNGELYFSSDYHIGMGGLDLFTATMDENGAWTVENMGYPMNSPFDDFGIAFVAGEDKGMFSSNRKGSRGDDLYEFVVPPKIFRAEGEVFNIETGTRVEGVTIRVIGTDGTSLRLQSSDGKFQYKLQPETEYIFAAFKDGFLRDKGSVSTIGLDNSKDFRFELFLTPTDAPIKLENINYEFGRWDLLPESKTALDTLVGLLILNPTITIEIMAHTDHVGSDQFNFDLSQKRAQSVVDYLIEKGISPQRLVAKGYGETWPKTVTRKIASQYDFLKRNDELTEEYIMKLTEEQQEIARSVNRRTEFRVISTDFIEKFEAEPEN